MTEDDEFGDEIDWSTVQLPSISASMAVPRPKTNAPTSNVNSMPAVTATSMAGGVYNHHSPGSAAAASYHSGYPPRNNSATITAGQNHSRAAAMRSTMGAASNLTFTNDNDADALRRQIQDLQTKLQNKDDLIFELEATAATSHAESAHRTQRAEVNAQKRIHLVEEDFRRMRMEAEKYKGSWIRQKKRVAELEGGRGGRGGRANDGGGGNRDAGGDRGAHAAADGRMSNSKLWGPLPAHVELRKVTPGIGDEENDNKNHMAGEDAEFVESPTKVGGSKRKSREISPKTDVDAIAAKTHLPRQPLVGCGAGMSNSVVFAGDSVRQRTAKHILNREEMGCYSSPPGGGGVRADANGSAATRARRDLTVEKETRIFVKSILNQMVDAPQHNIGSGSVPVKGNLSISGLVHVLLVRFNSLFHCLRNKDDGATNLDGDCGHVMEGQEDDLNHNVNKDYQPTTPPLDKNKIVYQSMVLALSNRALYDESQKTVSEYVMFPTVSWRAVLYLLHVLSDISLLSGNARDDLRSWFYKSLQTVGSGGGKSNTSPPSTEIGQGGAKSIDGDADSHHRIEGLPPKSSGRWSDAADRKEVLWTPSCSSGCSRGRSDNVWDPMTMARPCNTFFELLVGLMKGNIFKHSQQKNSTTEEESQNYLSGFEQEVLLQLVQIKAIEFVLALMSDAPPYDHAEDNHGNKTPYLWKFWFDSLLPSYSTAPFVTTGQVSLNGSSLSSDTHSIGDFLSPWEKSDGDYKNRVLGSGRKHSTRLLKENISAGKKIRAGHRSSRSNSAYETVKENNKESKRSSFHYIKIQRKRLSILLKNRILRSLSHFILCSSSVDQSMHNQIIVNGGKKSSLAKRILAAVLDEMEENIMPFLSARPPSDFHRMQHDDAEQRLELCGICIQFLLILSRSNEGRNEGIRMLRVQTRLESEHAGDPSRWSQSAIGCVTSVLDGALSFATGIEENDYVVVVLQSSTQLARALNAIVDQCIVFFRTLLLFVHRKHRQRSNSSSKKATTFLALILEHRTIFQSCCQRIIAHHSPDGIADPPRLLHFSERLVYHTKYLFEEVAMDEEKENHEGR